jgi:hypothetical protein
MDYFTFDYTFVVASCESCNSACSGSVAKMIYGADASWAGTRVTHSDARRTHSADHQAQPIAGRLPGPTRQWSFTDRVTGRHLCQEFGRQHIARHETVKEAYRVSASSEQEAMIDPTGIVPSAIAPRGVGKVPSARRQSDRAQT